MALHAGKIGTVTEVCERDSYTAYRIHCSSYYWSEDMLDLVSKKKGEPSSPEPLDFIPKKKHYSFNFTV